MYGRCSECNGQLYPEWYVEEEYKIDRGRLWKTGRKRLNINFLCCGVCMKKETVDGDTFAKEWYE